MKSGLKIIAFMTSILSATYTYASNPASIEYVDHQVSQLQTQINNISGGASYTVGQYAQGGVIFWLDPSNQHGLVAAIVDQDSGTGLPWYNGGSGSSQELGIHGEGVYIGKLNTNAMLALQSTGNAAYACVNYSVVMNGVTYHDWYLPDLAELNIMYLNRNTINTTALAHSGVAFSAINYWTSYESSNNASTSIDFSSGLNNTYQPNSISYKVRAVRYF